MAAEHSSERDKGDAFSVPPATFHNECFQHRSIWKIMHKTAMACRSGGLNLEGAVAQSEQWKRRRYASRVWKSARKMRWSMRMMTRMMIRQTPRCSLHLLTRWPGSGKPSRPPDNACPHLIVRGRQRGKQVFDGSCIAVVWPSARLRPPRPRSVAVRSGLTRRRQ